MHKTVAGQIAGVVWLNEMLKQGPGVMELWLNDNVDEGFSG